MLGVHVNVRRFTQSFMDAIRLAINLGWIADFTSGTVRMSSKFPTGQRLIYGNSRGRTDCAHMNSKARMIHKNLERC